MRALQYAIALGAIVVMTVWNAVMTRIDSPGTVSDVDDPDLIEHERNWYDYIRGFHAHHGSVDGEDVQGDHQEHGSFWDGLLRWQASGYLRGYTLGDDVYLAPNAPKGLRVHQAGHAPTFGSAFEPLRNDRRDNGGLPDEPLLTFDVMLPGGFPHTFVKLRDPRGLSRNYLQWLRTGRIHRE